MTDEGEGSGAQRAQGAYARPREQLSGCAADGAGWVAGGSQGSSGMGRAQPHSSPAGEALPLL